MPDFLAKFTPESVLLACAVTLLGGFVKGAVGYAHPYNVVGDGPLIDGWMRFNQEHVRRIKLILAEVN